MGTLRTQILFACIHYNDNTLVSHQIDTDNFTDTIQYFLQYALTEQLREGPKNKKLSFPIDRLQIHMLIDNDSWTYTCITPEKGSQLLAFNFLESVKSKFYEIPSLLSRSPTAAQNEFDRDFGPILASFMHEFNSGRGDKMSLLQSQVEDVKQVMLENVEKIIDRGEKLEDLLSKTEDLEAHGSGFRQLTREVHARAKCKNLKMWLIIGSFLGIILTFALLIATGVIPL
ncbi:vesicle-associated membrane protein 7 [Anabrus simplex]|uniref:vesicle-associated membrane protein 7 n=1 Tax=Anabrus simplex TaxID=316456 RepID=UPI0034DCD4A8